MKLVPVPNTEKHLGATSQHWLPFLEKIAIRSKVTLAELTGELQRNETQLHLIWDPDEQDFPKACHGIVGTRIKREGERLIGELVWCTGAGRAGWIHLLEDLELYLRTHRGCQVIRPIARMGWMPELKDRGYRETHVIMEKEL